MLAKEDSLKTGLKKSMVYDLISRGLFVKPVAIGERARAFINSEVDAINAARIAEKTDDEIKKLVRDLIAKRQQIADEMWPDDPNQLPPCPIMLAECYPHLGKLLPCVEA